MSESIDQRLNAAGLGGPQQRELRALLQSILTDLAAIKTQFNTLRGEINGHTHGGVTAGAGTTSAMAATASAQVSLNTSS
jgi:hypothetical protein